MSVLSTVLVYVGVPLVVIVLITALVMAGSDRTRRTRRYRPGRPYDFRPIWFLASPERIGRGDGHALERAQQAAIEAAPVLENSAGVRVQPGPVGGASDSW